MSTARCLISIPRHSRRWPLRLAIPVLALAAAASAGLIPTAENAVASAQSLAAGDDQECESVDLLLLMDQSASLNSADPSGEQRKTALRQIRRDLSRDDRVHVALVGFNEEALRHAPDFMPVSEGGPGHPSDADIQEALQGQDRTDYGVALVEAALEVFRRARPDSCRSLVWFTDGLHDTDPGDSQPEVDSAEDLRRRVCAEIAPMFASERIMTQVVLLGNSLQTGLRGGNQLRRSMADISKEIIGIITGQDVILGEPVRSRCETGVPPGDEIGVDEVADLVTALLEAIDRAVGMFSWRDCDRPAGARWMSDQLPAGTLIQEMRIYAYGGTFERYRLGREASQWIPMSGASRRLTLVANDLNGLSSGWVLEIEIAADPGRDIGDVSLACYSKPVDTPLMMTGTTTDGSGNAATVLLQDGPYNLGVDIDPFECAVEAFDLESDALASPLRYVDCGPGSNARFEFEAVQAGEVMQMTAALGHLIPEHAGVLWGDQGRLAVEVDVTTRPHLLSGEQVECSQPGDLPRVEAGLLGDVSPSRARIVAGACGVAPPDEGTLTVDVEDAPDGPDYHMEKPNGERIEGPLTLSSGDEPRQIRIVSDEMAPERLPQEPGEVTVTAEWQPGGDASPQSVAQETLRVPPAAQSPLECKSVGADGPVAGARRHQVADSLRDSNGPRGRIVVGECIVASPADGTFTVDLEGPDYHMENPDGERIEGPLTLDPDDGPSLIWIVGEWVSFPEVPPTAGEVAVIVEWQPAGGAPRLPVRQQVRIPQLEDVRLACGREDGLPRIESESPYRVAAEACRVHPPDEGVLMVDASAVADNLAYHVERSDGARVEGPFPLSSGVEPQTLRVVSETLGPAGWSTAGIVTLTVVLRPGDGVALVAEHVIEVPELEPVWLRCGSMQLSNIEGDEVPDEPLRATLKCEAPAQGNTGELRLRLVDGAGSPGSAALDWRFERGSTVLDDGRELVLEADEELGEVGLVTSGPLPNDRIEGDGTVVIEAQWMVSGWKEPLTGVTTARYSVDLWPRSVLWLAVLITLVAAMLSWLLLYGVVVFRNRLPAASNFYARRFEFSTYRDSRGGLRSAEIDSFNLEDHPSIPVNGDSSQKRLRSEALHIDAKHPKWWQIASLLRGGWGQASVGQNRVVAARPAGARGRAGSTPEQFTELAVVALDSRSGAAEPRGVAYVLVPRHSSEVPRHSSERSDLRRDLADALADLSGPRDTAARATPKPARGERPR